MCGIAGIISRNIISADLSKVSSKMRHRGPDDEGYYIILDKDKHRFCKGDDSVSQYESLHHIKQITDFKSALIHRRLSIIDLSPAGHQPMQDLNGRAVITFNGEIYNYIELKEDLTAKGYKFISNSDTEVILNAYLEWGADCVKKFIGMWAFVLYDRNNETYFCSRDRFGIKPFYYVFTDDVFCFASEIKALKEFPFVTGELNAGNAIKYIVYGNSQNNQTLFKNIYELEPGCNLIFSNNTFRFDIFKYYDVNNSGSGIFSGTETEYTEYFRNLFFDSVKLQLRSDTEVGSCLSGGLDSSSIVSAISCINPGIKLKTFTAAYNDMDIDESNYARELKNRYSTLEQNFIYPDANGYLNDFDKFIYFQDLPVASSSMYSQYCVMKHANEKGIKVLLDGQGADEYLGGYANFSGMYLLGLLKKINLHRFFKSANELKKNRSIKIRKEISRAIYYSLPENIKNFARRKKRISPKFIHESFFASPAGEELAIKSFRDLSVYSVKNGLRELLRYEDRNSMAFSIESRVPFLDHRIVDFSLLLPDYLKIKNGYSKYILRDSMNDVMPESIAWRKDKKGFVTPQLRWKEELKKEMNGYLNECRLPDFFNRKNILEINDNFISDSNNLSEYWKAISFIKWYNIFIDK